jgi:hypothetical protein
MSDAKSSLNILWDTLKLSAKPLKGRSDILVVAHLRVQQSNPQGYDEYRLNFEINRKHGPVSYDMEVRVPDAPADSPLWRYSGRRDLVVALRDRFLTTQLYAHVAGQLG